MKKKKKDGGTKVKERGIGKCVVKDENFLLYKQIDKQINGWKTVRISVIFFYFFFLRYILKRKMDYIKIFCSELFFFFNFFSIDLSCTGQLAAILVASLNNCYQFFCYVNF